MGLKLKSKSTEVITPSEMKDGDVGVVVSWAKPTLSFEESPVGFVVQRFDNNLVLLGERSGKSYTGLTNDQSCKVQILPKGTLIEIT